MSEQFTSAFGVMTTVTGALGVLIGDQIYEATDPLSIGPALGEAVLADWLPSSRQWVIVAIVT